jgi:hypothetical protein
MKKHLLSILICLNLALIGGNSMMTAVDSVAVSGGILELLGLKILLEHLGVIA